MRSQISATVRSNGRPAIWHKRTSPDIIVSIELDIAEEASSLTAKMYETNQVAGLLKAGKDTIIVEILHKIL